MNANNVAMMGGLVYEFRELIPVLEAHLEQFEGEILPHPMLSDVVRWLAAHVEIDRESCRSIWAWIERAYARGPEDVRELIAVSAVEMLPSPGEPGAALREFLGPELRRYDPWLA